MQTFQEIADFTSSYVDTEYQFETFRALINGMNYVYGMHVEGDIAEFGTMTGRTAVALSVCLQRLEEKYGQIDPRGGKKSGFLIASKACKPANQRWISTVPTLKQKFGVQEPVRA